MAADIHGFIEHIARRSREDKGAWPSGENDRVNRP